MRYRHQFLLDLYRHQKWNLDNQIWLFRHEHVLQEHHYEKVYLYCRNPKNILQEVTFLIQAGDEKTEHIVSDFKHLKRSYQPSLRGCLIELPLQMIGKEYSISILSYRIQGVEYPYLEENLEITLSDDQQSKAVSALLSDHDITIFPSMSNSYILCACGHAMKPGETCPNCHRTASDNAMIIEKGCSIYCKESFLKRYVTEEEMLYCRKHHLDVGTDLQRKAASLPIQIDESDYYDLEVQCKKRHQKTVIGITATISALLLCLILAFSLPSSNDIPEDPPIPDYSSSFTYPYEKESFDCEGNLNGYEVFLTFTGYDQSVDKLEMQFRFSSKDLGVDISQIDTDTLVQLQSAVLDQLGIDGNEYGFYISPYLYGDNLYFNITIVLGDISYDTLKKLQLTMISFYDMDEIKIELENEGMYCY